MGHAPEEQPARVFFALWPDEACRKRLAAWQRKLHPLCGGRVMRAETLHVTLVFVGEVAARRLEALEAAARKVRGKPFDMVFDRVRYWPHNGILYAAAEEALPQLTRLVENLQQHLADADFRFDMRAYTPHATLLRNAQWRVGPLPEMEEFAWPARDFVLVQSVLDAQGASYRVLARFPLGARAAG
jgi:2'-5' RNA ligase